MLSMMNFAFSAMNVALALGIPENEFAFVNWAAAVFCFGCGIICTTQK